MKCHVRSCHRFLNIHHSRYGKQQKKATLKEYAQKMPLNRIADKNIHRISCVSMLQILQPFKKIKTVQELLINSIETIKKV